MGRMPRIQVEKAIYYILSGGDNNQPIFRLDDDSATYLEILSQYKRQHQFKLFAYCLVPGTISLLIEPSATISVSDIMHDLNSKYTKYFNRKYGKTGHLFQERYRMILIEKESNLLEMTAYINLKPKLQIPPYDINTYPYSSYSAYIKEDTLPKGPNIGEEIKEVLSYLKGDTYQEIVAKIALNKLSNIDDELASKQIIGSDKFVLDVKLRMKNEKIKGPEIAKSAPEPELLLEPEPEQEPQPEPEPEQLLEPDPQPAPELKPVLVPDTKLSIESMEQPVPVPAQKDESVPDTKPFTKPKSNILISIVIVILSVVVIACSILFTYTKTIEMKKYLDAELSRKDSQLKNKLDKERNSLYKTLTDRYGAEKVTYLEKAQRLESEKETYKTTAERLETEKNSYQEMAKRLSDEKTSAQAAAERLEQEKKKIEEQLILIQKSIPEQK